MAELFFTPGIMALPIMLRPACRRRDRQILFALAAKFAWSDAFGQAREIGWLLVFDGSGSHFVKATVMGGPD